MATDRDRYYANLNGMPVDRYVSETYGLPGRSDVGLVGFVVGIFAFTFWLVFTAIKLLVWLITVLWRFGVWCKNKYNTR